MLSYQQVFELNHAEESARAQFRPTLLRLHGLVFPCPPPHIGAASPVLALHRCIPLEPGRDAWGRRELTPGLSDLERSIVL